MKSLLCASSVLKADIIYIYRHYFPNPYTHFGGKENEVYRTPLGLSPKNFTLY